VTRILESALYVEDVERSVEFYRRVFGFEISDWGGSRLVALGVEGRQVLLICKRGASLGLPVGAHDGEGPLHLAFAIDAETLPAWEAWLGIQGIAIEEKKTWERGGTSLYFRDLDGHLLELATPGVWSIY